MRPFLVLCVLLLALGMAGCARSPVPPLDQIATVRLTVRQFRPDASVKSPCDALLTREPDFTEVIAWLKEIDWSQTGTDLAVVSIPQPDGSITLTTKDKATHDFGFYWDGSLINGGANRLIRGGDMAKLEQIVQRVCK